MLSAPALAAAARSRARASAAQKSERLEAELNAAKANSVKARAEGTQTPPFNADAASLAPNPAQEAIRVGHTELGEHLASRGDLQGAFKAFVRSRDYSTSPAHIVAMCLAVVRVAVEMNNFNHVVNYVQKAESAADAADALTNAKVRLPGVAASFTRQRRVLRAFMCIAAQGGVGACAAGVEEVQDGGAQVLRDAARAWLRVFLCHRRTRRGALRRPHRHRLL